MQSTLYKFLQLQKINNYKSDIGVVDNINIYITALDKIAANCNDLLIFDSPKNEYNLYAKEYLKLIEQIGNLVKELAYGFMQISHELQQSKEIELYVRILVHMKQAHELFVLTKEEDNLRELQEIASKLLEHFRNCKEELQKNNQPASTANDTAQPLLGDVLT